MKIKIKGRAETDEQKKKIINSLFKAWKASPLQRLGQLISNATHKIDLFHIEDQAFADKMMEFVNPKSFPKPRFQHDCDHCIYLGQDDKHDFYFCPQDGQWNSSVIARFGSDGGDYASGLESAIQHEKNFPWDAEYPLVKALKMARARNLISVSKH